MGFFICVGDRDILNPAENKPHLLCTCYHGSRLHTKGELRSRGKVSQGHFLPSRFALFNTLKQFGRLLLMLGPTVDNSQSSGSTLSLKWSSKRPVSKFSARTGLYFPHILPHHRNPVGGTTPLDLLLFVSYSSSYSSSLSSELAMKQELSSATGTSFENERTRTKALSRSATCGAPAGLFFSGVAARLLDKPRYYALCASLAPCRTAERSK